jgi:single-stranded-DNA-specific exonuclease
VASDLAHLVPPESMLNVAVMARVLGDAIAARKRLLIVADYDADGATACAVGMRALTAFGAIVEYLVPNRFEYGYGLTPEIVRLAHTRSIRTSSSRWTTAFRASKAWPKRTASA